MLNKPTWTEPAFTSVGRSGPEERSLEVRDVVAFLKRGRFRILALAVMGAALATAYGIAVPPTYTARAQIVIDPKMPPLFGDQNADGRFPLDTGQLASQIAILKSEKIALMVIEGLKLDIDPELSRPISGSGLRLAILAMLFGANPNASPASVRIDQGAAADPPAEATSLQDVSSPPETKSLPDAKQSALEAFNGRLDARRSGIAYALDISFYSTDPDKAARIVNAVVGAFMLEKAQARSEIARQASEWLTTRIEQVRLQMNASVRMAQELRASHDYRLRRPRDDAEQGSGLAEHGKNATDFSRRSPSTIEELESAAETSRKIYESLTGVVLEATQRQSAPTSDSRVITAAARPLRQSSPSLRVIVPLGAVAGAGLYVGLGLVGLLMDGRTRTRRQVREATGRDCLACLVRPGRHWTLMGRSSRSRSRMMGGRQAPSATNEGLRWIQFGISAAARTSPPRVIGLAPADDSAGHTAIAAELARLYAEAGTRTLLIEATTTRVPALTSGSSLVEAGADRWRHSLVALHHDCDLLPFAVGEHGARHDGLGAAEMEVTLTSLLNTYDIIIVDLPPMRATADILTIAPLLDGVVLVARWGRTPIRALSEAGELLETARARVLGSVLIDVHPTSPDA